jgi:hypothetical protein
MALDVLPAFLSEAVERHQCRRPSDALPSEPNVSDASDGVHPDATAGGCPSGHPDHLAADVDAEKLAGRELVVHPADASLAPEYLQAEPEV